MALYGFGGSVNRTSPVSTPAPTGSTFTPPGGHTNPGATSQRVGYVAPGPAPTGKTDYTLPGGGQAQAAPADLGVLYDQLLGAIGRQPLPADTSGISNEIINQYNATAKGLAALQQQALAQQATIAKQIQGMAQQAGSMNLPIANHRGLEAQLLAEARRRRPSRHVMMYGFA